MYIRELTGYKSNPIYQQAKQDFDGDLKYTNKRINTLIQFQKYLANNGFNPVGVPGQAGTAFEHPGYPWVFKIFTHDQAYLDFLKYARQHQDNSLMPKFKGNIMKINDKTFVVRIEKLYTLERGDANNSMLGITASIQELADFDFFEKNDPGRIEMLKHNYPEIYALMMDLLHTFPTHTLDMHRGNIMQRENGDIVVIDPLV